MSNGMNSLTEARAALTQAQEYLRINGIQYDLAHWVTIKEYVRRYGLSAENVVTNWINRGVIPAENVVVVPALNNLRLIKAVPYKEAVQ